MNEGALSTGGSRQPDPLAALPASYARWWANLLVRITDALGLDLILERICPAESLRILDVSCGDGVLTVEHETVGIAP